VSVSTPAPSERIPRDVWRVSVVIVFGAFMAGLDTSLVNVGLDTIAHRLGAGLTDTQWVSSGYLLALATALPACPWLSRRFGADRVWLTALVVFTVASLGCAVAPTLPLLILGRLIQGVGGGLLVPAGQTILARSAGPGRMGRVMSTAGIAVVLAPAIGPAVGGLLIAHLSWRWLFLVNVPIGITAFILGRRTLPVQARSQNEHADVTALVLLCAGLPLLSYGIIELGQGQQGAIPALVCAVGGATLLLAFVVRSLLTDRRELETPGTLDISLFTIPSYAAAQLTVLLTGASLFGGLVILPLYWEVLRGQSVQTTGLLLLAYGAGAAFALRLGGILTDRLGGGVSAVMGLVITIAATLPFAFLPADSNVVTVELLQAARGIGVGLAGLPAMSSAFSAAGTRVADATTTANIVQRTGGSLGSALLVIALESGTKPLQIGAFHSAFGLLAAGATAALLAALWLSVSQRRFSDLKGFVRRGHVRRY
jgi:EmrB/QacA subfamily drug resistance transporter